MPDFDGAAAQIMLIAYGDPNAREQIAQILEMTWMQAKTAGIEEARQIYNDAFKQFVNEGGSL